jgi:carbamate kinase
VDRPLLAPPLVVVAIGGNALVGDGGDLDVAAQRERARTASAQLAHLAEDRRLVVTHGNGPQVGLLAMQAADDPELPPPPLDVLDAESVGLIGYLLVEALSSHVEPERVSALLTRVEVDIDDPAFGAPSKPVGPWFGPERGRELAQRHGWDMTETARGWRRIVPSPEPIKIVEIGAIRTLASTGQIVIAGGGGGIPVATTDAGLVGVEAVVDKDLTSALMAIELGADRLIVLTDVDAVYLDFGHAHARPLGRTTTAELRAHEFAAGSMGPKVEAACRFVEATGTPAAIGALTDASGVIAGTSGTQILPNG